MRTELLGTQMKRVIDWMDTEAEDRVLTMKLIPGYSWSPAENGGCLVGLVLGCGDERYRTAAVFAQRQQKLVQDLSLIALGAMGEFDRACRIHGAAAVGAAIRARIHRNRDWDLALEYDRALDERAAWVKRVFAGERITEEEAVCV